MPLYEFRCKQCGHVFEKIQSYSAPDDPCPRCAGEVERLLSAPAIQFKGSGFYLTDYGKAGAPKTGGAGNGSESGGSSSGDGGQSSSDSGKAAQPSSSGSSESTPSSKPSGNNPSSAASPSSSPSSSSSPAAGSGPSSNT